VLRVYLDQNKWLDLAWAAKGDPRGDRYADVLAAARACVEAGAVSFPLNVSRYIETSKRGRFDSRRDLALTMAALSRFHGIAPPRVLVPAEIDATLHARFGVPAHPRTPEVFGRGIEHAVGGGISTSGLLRLSKGLVLSPGQRAQADAVMQEALEHGLLLGAPPALAESAAHQAIVGRMTQDRQFAEGQDVLAAKLAETKMGKRTRLDLALHAYELGDLLEPLTEALVRAGLDPKAFIESLLKEGLVDFVRSLPTRAVAVDLYRDKHAQRQQKWEPNDLLDLVGLPVAAVHCDVVVTERQWANRMRRAKIPQRHGTRVLNDLKDLTAVLVDATRSD
jgi:hypothetical protein